MLKETYQIPTLPPPGATETIAVLKEAARAHRFLGITVTGATTPKLQST